jgi:Tfp pilus assembly protein PilO
MSTRSKLVSTALAGRDTQSVLRMVVGGLLVLSMIGAGLVLFPPGGSDEALEQQLQTLQAQTTQRKRTLEETRRNVAAIEKARKQGDAFLSTYFLDRRTAYSTLLGELDAAARQSQIKAKEHSFNTEPIEGSDTLSMMTITANYEGTYKDLMNFVYQIDKSARLLIIESLNAAPQGASNVLGISMKIDTFVREEAGE